MKKKISFAEQEENEIVVANMNVEGMPWYQESLEAKSAPRAGKEERTKKKANPYQDKEALSTKQTFYVLWGAMKAGLLVAGIFALALILFTLLCTKLWL